jgi:hypothetical protein
MSADPARSFLAQVGEMAATAAPLPAEQALESLRQRIHAILTRDLKFAEVEWSERRNLVFAVESRYCQLVFDETDPEFLSIHGGAIAVFKDEQDAMRAMDVASSVTRDVKVAKVFVQRVGGEWLAGASVEVLLPGLESVDKAFVRRLVRLLVHAIADFHRRCAPPPVPRS